MDNLTTSKNTWLKFYFNMGVSLTFMGVSGHTGSKVNSSETSRTTVPEDCYEPVGAALSSRGNASGGSNINTQTKTSSDPPVNGPSFTSPLADLNPGGEEIYDIPVGKSCTIFCSSCYSCWALSTFLI